MASLITKVRIIDIYAGIDVVDDVILDKDSIDIAPTNVYNCEVIDGRGKVLAPGLVDLHVHFREPGFIHKEEIASGIKAALSGGVTSALVMPNTFPALDQPKHVQFQENRAKKFGFDLMVAACASRGLLGALPSDIEHLARAGVKAVTDDGRPIQDQALMEEILRLCRRHNIVCMQHAEDLSISKGASLNLGYASTKLGLRGQDKSAEYGMVKRDLALAEKIGSRYHVLHVSCQESLKLVSAAKRARSKVTCEVSPHHLLLSERDIDGLDTFKKMNPPLRSPEDVLALREGLLLGTIDAVASDHAPHSLKEKQKKFDEAPFGVVGVESAILVLLTLVKKHGLPLKTALAAMTTGPARVLGESHRIGTMMGTHALKNAVLLDPDHHGIFSHRNLHGRSKNSPFIGMELFGKVVATFLHGNLVYRA